MGVQYIYDAEGRKTSVIVSVDLWDAMNSGKSANRQSGAGLAGEMMPGIVDTNPLRQAFQRLCVTTTPH